MKRELAHISLVVKDYDEAIEYYTTVLDFELIEDIDQPEQNKRWVVVRPHGSDATSIVLARPSNDRQKDFIGDQTGGRVTFFLSTDDFWRDHALFQSRGVTFVREPLEAPYGTVAVFKDLYGNLWDLIQYRE
ncbi:MAG: VOC family protein [Pseudomonadota bacterium]